MNTIQGRNFLEQIVGAYTGALIQREHIKNKRLDDIITTAGNYQQANLQAAVDRVSQRLSGLKTDKGVDIGPSVEYGDMPRQLGVTPYPPPPSSIKVDESFESEDHHVRPNPVPPPPPVAPGKEDSFQGSVGSPQVQDYPFSPVVETKKAGFPWTPVLAGTALAASIAANGMMLYKAKSPSTLPTQPPTEPAHSQSVINPSLDFSVERGQGSVSIGVE